MAAKKNSPSFEDAMKRLDEISLLLEGGKASLEESLSLFEEGVGLVRLCEEMLNKAEKKIKILTSALSTSDAEEENG